MLRQFKTEINPNDEQKVKILRTVGTCRYVYNLFISHNKERFDSGEKFVDGYSFSKWLNHEYLKEHPENSWIKEVSSKAVKQSIMNADRAYKRFFKKLSKFPRFKKKSTSDVKMYFVKENDTACLCERHRIKVPTLGWVRIKQKGYIPTSKDGYVVKSGTVSMKAGRYYVSVLIDVPETPKIEKFNEGIGIDLGIKDLAVCSNGKVFKNTNKSERVRKLEKKLRREQRRLSRKYLNFKKGNSTPKNLEKQRLKVQRIYKELDNIKTDYINKTVSEIVKTKPSYITVEDLNIRGMMKNRHLSKAIAQQKLYEFKTKLKDKSRQLGIEVREVSPWYPSSKMCHKCGTLKIDLKLSDRIYRCECGYVADRDFNASLNLRDAIEYRVA